MTEQATDNLTMALRDKARVTVLDLISTAKHHLVPVFNAIIKMINRTLLPSNGRDDGSLLMVLC